MRLRDELGHLYTDEMFGDLFSATSQLAQAPWCLSPGHRFAVRRGTDRPPGHDTIQEAYLAQFDKDEETPLLVADAALYSETTLKAMPDGTRWLTRVVGALTALKQLYDLSDSLR